MAHIKCISSHSNSRLDKYNFCSNPLIVADLGYEWHFMLSLFQFLREKKNI